MSTLAIIPARKDSRRFPGKNVALLDGKPLLVHAIERAREAQALGVVDAYMVSTDGWGEPERIAREVGAPTHRRADAASVPGARVIDIVQDFLWAGAEGHGSCSSDCPGRTRYDFEARVQRSQAWDTVCVLLATSPLRTLRHIVESRLLLERGPLVLSVTPFRQDIRGALAPLNQYVVRCDSEQWPDQPYLKHDGTVAWIRAELARSDAARRRGFYCADVIPYHVPPEESVDVDSPLDLEWAEFLLVRRRQTEAPVPGGQREFPCPFCRQPMRGYDYDTALFCESCKIKIGREIGAAPFSRGQP